MTEEHKLILTLIPKFEMGAISEAASGVFNAGGQTKSDQKENSGYDPSQSEATRRASESREESRAAEATKNDSRWDHFKEKFSSLLPHRKSHEEEEQDERKSHAKRELYKKILTSSISEGTRAFRGIMTTSLGFVQNIYKRMREASPLLQAIESMFNLAVRLFFMPLGNKLAEVMLPAVIKLVDDVTGIWDAFEGQTLGQMLSTAISEGVKIFGDYISEIGETLRDQKGVVGAIGRFLVKIGDFVEHRLEGLIEAILGFASSLLDHFVEYISIYVGLQTALIGAVIGGSDIIFGSWGAAAGAGIGFATGFGATEGVMRGVLGFADGGYVPATPGGQLAIIGEGGEGEYIVPESQAEALRGNNITNNFYISGVTSEELGNMIDDKINEQISLSKIRGAF